MANSFSPTINPLYGNGDLQTKTFSASPVAATITNFDTILKIATASADFTLNLTIDASLKTGARLTVIHTSDTTARTMTPGTGFIASAATVAGVISKSVASEWVYDGTAFSQAAAKVTLT